MKELIKKHELSVLHLERIDLWTILLHEYYKTRDGFIIGGMSYTTMNKFISRAKHKINLSKMFYEYLNK